MKIGNTSITDIKRGNARINKIYQGNSLIWQNPTVPPPPPSTLYQTVENVEEFVGPFASWHVMSGGDGTTDCTPLLQTLLDQLEGAAGYRVIYFPAGTYRFTDQVTGHNLSDIQLVGQHPDTVTFVWDGPAGGTLLYLNSIMYSSIRRITFDGNGIAKAAINQSYNDHTANGFDTGNEYADLIFKDVQFGIMGGQTRVGFAETSILRCKFENCTVAAITLGNFNALDCWIWDSVFINCQIGVSNLYGSYSGVWPWGPTYTNLGAGNFGVNNCVFSGSIDADIHTEHTTQCEFSFRDNLSVGSNRFLLMNQTDNAGQTTLQSNVIIDTATTPIEVRNQGPLNMIDNNVRYNGVSVLGACTTGTDILAIGNTFSTSSPITTTGRLLEIDTNISSDITYTTKSIAGTPLTKNRTIFDLPSGSTATEIQNAINQASALNSRAIVHLSYGTYNGNFIIPANSNIIFCGDSTGDRNPTKIVTGDITIPALKIMGPSKVMVRDLSFFGAPNYTAGTRDGEGIWIENVDQANSRIFMHQVISRSHSNNCLTVENLTNCKVNTRNCEWQGGGSTGVVVKNAELILFGGLMWGSALSLSISQNGKVLMRDVWYEDQTIEPFFVLNDTGTLSLDSARVSNIYDVNGRAGVLNNFNGKLTFLGTGYSDKVEINGTALSKVLFLGNIINLNNVDSTFINNNQSADVRQFNQRNATDGSNYIGSRILPDQGIADLTFINDMLTHIRSIHADPVLPVSGQTDIQLHRVWATQGTKGIWIH